MAPERVDWWSESGEGAKQTGKIKAAKSNVFSLFYLKKKKILQHLFGRW